MQQEDNCHYLRVDREDFRRVLLVGDIVSPTHVMSLIMLCSSWYVLAIVMNMLLFVMLCYNVHVGCGGQYRDAEWARRRGTRTWEDTHQVAGTRWNGAFKIQVSAPPSTNILTCFHAHSSSELCWLCCLWNITLSQIFGDVRDSRENARAHLGNEAGGKQRHFR